MAAKDVAKALTDLINSTKNSSGKPANDPAMDSLKVSAQVSSILGLTASYMSKITIPHFCGKSIKNK